MIAYYEMELYIRNEILKSFIDDKEKQLNTLFKGDKIGIYNFIMNVIFYYILSYRIDRPLKILGMSILSFTKQNRYKKIKYIQKMSNSFLTLLKSLNIVIKLLLYFLSTYIYTESVIYNNSYFKITMSVIILMTIIIQLKKNHTYYHIKNIIKSFNIDIQKNQTNFDGNMNFFIYDNYNYFILYNYCNDVEIIKDIFDNYKDDYKYIIHMITYVYNNDIDINFPINQVITLLFYVCKFNIKNKKYIDSCYNIIMLLFYVMKYEDKISSELKKIRGIVIHIMGIIYKKNIYENNENIINRDRYTFYKLNSLIEYIKFLIQENIEPLILT
jgi:hypothetical protein